MIINFDKFNHQEQPDIILCNPNKDEIAFLGLAYNIVQTLRFNALSEIEFVFPQSVDNMATILSVYDLIEEKRLIKFADFGYYTIKKVEEILDGKVNVKKINCESQECELNSKRINSFSGTYKFYDPIDPDETLLYKVQQMIPTWSIGVIDPLLWNKYRTFSINDSTVYAFMMNEVSTTYGCIFIFDTTLKTINAYTVATATTNTDIFISFDNLVKEATFKKIEEEITTCLYCYGGKDLDIRAVNPLGGNAIYNFTYYKNTNWMTQDLIDAITAWELKVADQQPRFANMLTELKIKKAELVILESDLVDLQGEYTALDGIRKVRIEGGLPYTDILSQLNAKQAQINSKNIQITSKKSDISFTEDYLQSIVDDLDIKNTNNFTANQYKQLSLYIFENTYQNENLIQLDSMTPAQVQEASQELYDQAQGVIGRLAFPRYEFSCNAINFLALKEFQSFINQMDLGAIVTVQLSDSINIETVVLEINIDYNDPSNFKITFSNRLRLDNNKFIFGDLLGQVVKTGSNVSFDKLKWSDWSDDYKDDVSLFITSSLDATRNNLISSVNQEILINQNGLRGRTFVPATQTYKPTQVWLTSSVLAFSRDNFNTASLALGEVTINNQKIFGLVADAVVGRLLAGNQLTITNVNNNFTLDANGATLNNASFTLNPYDGKSKILLDPNVGIKIQSNEGGTWRDKFFVDSSGNLRFSGDLTGASGTFSGSINAAAGNIGGWHIDALGIFDNLGNYIRSTGNVKLGNLLIAGATATFTGTIYADRLVGEIANHQIGNNQITDSKVTTGLNAGKVTNGTMSGDRIWGGRISWGGTPSSPTAVLGISEDGAPYLNGNIRTYVTVGGIGSASGLVLEPYKITIRNDSVITIGTPYPSTSNVVVINGRIISNGSVGLNSVLTVSTPYGNMNLVFTNGIITNHYYL